MRYSSTHCLLCAACLLLLHRPLDASVTSYSALDDDGRMILTSVSVKTGGKVTIFDAAKLIPVTVTQFRSKGSVTVIAPFGVPPSTKNPPANLLDTVLNSGLINPTGPSPDAKPGLRVEFGEPVVNRPGDDLVFFEMHTRANSPEGGDPFLIAAVHDGKAGKAHRVERFDVGLDHPRARPILSARTFRSQNPPEKLSDLRPDTLQRAGSTDSMPFKVLALGLDLTTLGVPEGAQVTGLVINNVPARGPSPDFLCIAGLPEATRKNTLEKEPTLTKAPQKPILPPMLEAAMKNVDEVVFAVRRPGTDHWYANFGFYSAPRSEYPPQRAPGEKVKLPPIYKDGGSLRILNIRTKKIRTLIDDPKGALRDPCVHYDGKRILFSWRKAGTHYYNLYEIRSDGTGQRQITDGPHNDIEPTYLPDGGIVFCSDRSNRFVNCWRTPVATLYRCEADGTGLRMLSSNVEHDNTPWILPDGRILYLRWEYVDRNQNVFHHLWTTNPDGTGQMVYFGNMHPGIAMLDGKAIPGSHKVVASFSPGHGKGEHAGHVTIVDPRRGPDHRGNARRISRGPAEYRDPYAFTENCFLVAKQRSLLIMDGKGRTETIHGLKDKNQRVWLHEPRPLVPRPREPGIPPRIDLEDRTGTFFLSNVYAGRNMTGVKRGEITHLLVLAQLPKPVSFSGGMWPITAGGTFTLARVLGTIPVAADGSAFFKAPALQSLFFVALDAKGLSVKRMHSFATLQPGENTGCVGCHEPRTSAPIAALPRQQAAEREPDTISPITDQPQIPEFVRDVQPILTEHCVRCHNPTKNAARLNFCGDRTPLFTEGYWALTQRGLYSDGRNAMRSNHAPRTIGSSASKILSFLDGSHHHAKPTSKQRKTIWLWIEAGAPFAGTYAALGSGICPVDFPEPIFEKRCAACHAQKAKGRLIGGRKTVYRFGKKGPYLPLVHTLGNLRDIRARHGYFKFGYARTPQSLCNLSRPEMSLLLRAHLTKTAGGLELGGKRIFASTQDEGYQEILKAIQKAGDRLAKEKRFDMPDFRPNDYYLHHMVKYGILPQMPPPGPVDPYPIDQAYWATFTWQGITERE